MPRMTETAGQCNISNRCWQLALLAFAWIISEHRHGVAWRSAAAGLLLTFVTALILLKLPGVARAFGAINDAVGVIAAASRAGTSFVFGYLGGGQLPYDLKVPGAEFVLALQALPIVLLMSVLTTLLFHWRILPLIVRGFSRSLERTLKVGGAVGLSTAANIFLGMVEAPLFIRPYLASLTRSELFTVMTGGMAGIAGTVLVIYATVLGPLIPDAAAHFVIASVLGAPAAILGQPDHGAGAGRPAHRRHRGAGRGKGRIEHHGRNRPRHGRRSRTPAQHLRHADRAGRLVDLANAIIGVLPPLAGAPITLQRLLGIAMAPVCWLIGIPWDQAVTAGGLMGIKTVVNEFIAYVELSKSPADALDPRSRLILLYAMGGFANFGSLGIMIAGLAPWCPTGATKSCRSA